MLKGATESNECVVLLHGLTRGAGSMKVLEKRLALEGYKVVNIGYPSRKYPIEVLADMSVGQGIAECQKTTVSKINFVTHSLGGILVRSYLKSNECNKVGRVVMLGPPNQGSEVVDKLKGFPGYKLLNGPAGMQLGTKLFDIPKSLGPVSFELGVIAGTQSINPILSALLPYPNDGKVSVESAKVEGMLDFVSMPTTHPFMMKNADVIDQIICFLKQGKFQNTTRTDYGQ